MSGAPETGDLAAAEDGKGGKTMDNRAGDAGDAVEVKRPWLFRSLFGATPIIVFATLLLAALVAMTVGLLVHYYDNPSSSSSPSPSPPTERPRFPEPPYNPLDYRLPKNLKPLHYDIDLKPDFYPPRDPSEFKFDGWSTAYLECLEPTDWIYLHIRMLNVTDTMVLNSNGEAIRLLGTEIDEDREFYKIHLSRSLAVGEVVRVMTTFSGPLLRDMVGLYYSQYYLTANTSVPKYMVGTQFEAAGARKAFPCMDEPTFKQTFTAALWTKPPMIAVSNMPVNSTEDMGAGWQKVHFNRTNVVMTTYLIAFAVAEYTYVENRTSNNFGDETPVRIYARPDAIAEGQGDYIAETAPLLMGELEDYFQFPFALPKLDHISISDFAAGAMENWGLITYRESRLMFDPLFCGQVENEALTVTVAHELVHMWLGDTVTCDWWSEIWLNEGGATYWEHWSTQNVTGWDMTQIFLARSLYPALRADDNANLHPLHVPTYSAEESENVFTTISYDKGGSIIRMMEHLFLGTPNFHRAYVNYINENQFKTATYKTLVAAWAAQSGAAGNNMKGVNLTAAAYTWIEQLGFPIIRMTRTDNLHVEVTQHMMLEYPERPVKDSKFPSTYGYTWYVPVTYITSQQSTRDTLWLQRDNRTLTLTAPLQPSDWILGNHLAQGFYRVNYDNNNWDMLIAQLNTNSLVFDVSNRGQLIHDSLAFGKAGDLDQLRGLKTTQFLVDETEWLPWFAFDQSNAFLDWVLAKTPAYESYKSYVRGLVAKNYATLGWNELEPNSELLTKHLRTLTLNLACVYELPHCVSEAQALFNSWHSTGGTSYTIMRPDIRRSVICTALTFSSVDKWQFVLSRYARWTSDWMGPDSVERIRLRNALSCSRSPSTLRLLFDMAANEHPTINPADSLTILVNIATSIVGNDVAWTYLNENWDTMPLSNSSKITVLENVILRFSTQYDLDRLTAFLDSHPPNDFSEQERHDNMLFSVQSNVRWQARNYDEVAAWLSSLPPN